MYRSAVFFFFLLPACSGSTLDIGGGPADDTSDGGSNEATDASSSDAGSCDIDNVTGTFIVTYTRKTGDCGDLPSAEYTLSSDVLWNTPGCTVQKKVTSKDRCESTGSADCVVGTSQEHIEGTISETSSSALDGTVSITVTNAQGQCSGTYAIAYRRK